MPVGIFLLICHLPWHVYTEWHQEVQEMAEKPLSFIWWHEFCLWCSCCYWPGAFHAGKTPAADSDEGGSGSDKGDWLHNSTGPTCLNKESTGTEVMHTGLDKEKESQVRASLWTSHYLMSLFLQNASTSVSSSHKHKTSLSTASSTNTSSSKHTKCSHKNHTDLFAGMSDFHSIACIPNAVHLSQPPQEGIQTSWTRQQSQLW